MIVLKAALTAVALLIAAALIGENLKRKDESLLMSIVYGFVLEWAVAFFIVTPMVVLDKTLSFAVRIMVPVYIILASSGLARAIIVARKNKEKRDRVSFSASEIIYLGVFAGIIIFELYKTIFYAYADGDDAYYVATARVAEASDKMYRLDPYVGIPIGINPRYAIAPFPMWIAALARISGIDSTTLSFNVISPVLILVTYFLFNEISKLLFGVENREKRYMFLVLAAVFELFSNVSTSTAGTFMLTRARQGKEALACIILPLMFYELFWIIKSDGQIRTADFLILLTTATAAALTSFLGNVLAPLMLFGAGIWMLVKRKGIKNIILLAAGTVVNLLTILLYFKIN